MGEPVPVGGDGGSGDEESGMATVNHTGRGAAIGAHAGAMDGRCPGPPRSNARFDRDRGLGEGCDVIRASSASP